MDFRPIDKKNPPKAVLDLSLEESQRTYLDPVNLILKEYQDLDNWKAISIHLDDELHTMIGFAVIGLCDEEAWIDDLMIDKAYQGKGYGKQALNYLINELMLTYQKNEVYLSCYQHNLIALNFYQKFGFEVTGRYDVNGEIILVYKM